LAVHNTIKSLRFGQICPLNIGHSCITSVDMAIDEFKIKFGEFHNNIDKYKKEIKDGNRD